MLRADEFSKTEAHEVQSDYAEFEAIVNAPEASDWLVKQSVW